MLTFADRLQAKIIKNNSLLCAGIDPDLDSLPQFVINKAKIDSQTNDQYIYNILVNSYLPAIEQIADKIACCKINIAFFEQYGLAGLKAFRDILNKLRSDGQVVIVDAKRGDIGSTAVAYSKAFLRQAEGGSSNFESDCLTVNPFLGSDTVEVFINDCKKYSKGIFVLVKTSNPQSDWLQSRVSANFSNSEFIADWLGKQSEMLKGECGFSGLGAVIGATYPQQAVRLRSLMPTNFFLIPGFGTQGASAKDALAACIGRSLKQAGLVVNASRALFSAFSASSENYDELGSLLISRCENLNRQLNSELD